MKIALFYNESPGTIGAYFRSALETLGHAIDHFDVAATERCSGSFDVYLRIDHGDYAQDLPRHFRPKVFYVVDTHLKRSWKAIHRQARHYDLVFCVQQQAAGRLPRASWVPLGCDPQIHQAAPSSIKYDVAFVGTDGGVPRKFLLQELRERFPNSFIGKAPHTEMAAIYGAAKIGFHYIECTSPLKDHVSMRVYEILASGTLLMANALAQGAFEALGFQDGRQLVVYRSPRELFEKVGYYLSHGEERRTIAQAGQALVLAKHTYLRRARKMTEIIRQQLAIT